MRAMREACGDVVHMKVILATGELGSLVNVYKASMVAMMAGQLWFLALVSHFSFGLSRHQMKGSKKIRSFVHHCERISPPHLSNFPTA